MENFRCLRLDSSLFLILLLKFIGSSLAQSVPYNPPTEYFINCGSDSSLNLNNRNFAADRSSASFTLSASQSNNVQAPNSSSTDIIPLYGSARIFRRTSSYEFEIAQDGIYVVRLHFLAFSSEDNLSRAQFDVLASGFFLLSNFTVQNGTESPVIREFLLTVNAGKFRVVFRPSSDSSFAFINALETFRAPSNFTPSAAFHITPEGPRGIYADGISTKVLSVTHRVNVGGGALTPENSTLWRNWVSDDDYLFFRDAAINISDSNPPRYQDGMATQYDAPNLVYQTARQLNIDPNRMTNFFNISWRFGVKTNVTYLVRLHFCDIVSRATNATVFNLYIYAQFGDMINAYDQTGELRVPFYMDYVVESDSSGFMNISIGPRSDSQSQNAFLNGVEIMELLDDQGSVPDGKGSGKKIPIILGSAIGGGVLIIVAVVVLFLLSRKRRKGNSGETFNGPVVSVYGGLSSSRNTDRTGNASPFPDLDVGLKVPLSEILQATKNFDSKVIIGEGGFGKVYKGILRNDLRVAVKRSEPGHGQGILEFQTEITVLPRIRHRHLVSLIGYCMEKSEMILVYEFMENGTLREHLYNLHTESPKPRGLSWEQRLEICIGAAKGLYYLHTGLGRPIIHRDIKSTNILLDEHFVAKVADFGLSKSGPLDQSHVSTEVKGSFGYLDPEYYKCLQLTQKSDVYSFGVLLLEVLCARPAINNQLPRQQINLAEWGMSWQNEGKLEKIVDPLLVGKINPNSLTKFGKLVEKCLQEYGVDRPNMVDVLWDLEYCLKLQNTAASEELNEDSNTGISLMELPPGVVHRLPSRCLPEDEDDKAETAVSTLTTDSSDDIYVFSQLKMDEAR